MNDNNIAKEAVNSSWGGRFSEPTDAFVQRFTASHTVDRRLYNEDITGSLAHAAMLTRVNILTEKELVDIQGGLQSVKEDIEQGTFEWKVELEDVHMNIEAALTHKIGIAGKKLHTGRSRNDQVATDIRLHLRSAIDDISIELTHLQSGLLSLAKGETETIMPGFTHMQVAQPVSFGHHLMAWFEMLDRDFDRLQDCRKRLNICPLGAAALAGTTYPIDRDFTAKMLGFDRATRNSLDSVSDRDFAIEFCSAASLILMHLSRFSEELILWTSAQFNFIDLPDRFCTGSSIMPQKKNPDVPELVRGKTGRVYGNLTSLLTLMKSQPLAYNKDNQEDKEPLFDTIDTLKDCLRAFSDMVPAIKANKKEMYESTLKGYATATDLADYLVKKNMPFRDAHEVVGKAVALGIKQGIDLSKIALEDLQQFSMLISHDVYEILTLEGSLNARNHLGGTAPEQVKIQIEEAEKRLVAERR